MFQRPHQRSERAIRKDYAFVSRPLAVDVGPILDEIRAAPLEWLDSQWKWHIQTHFALLRAGQRRTYAGSELTHGHSIDQPNLAKLPRVREWLDRAFPEPPRVAWLGVMPPRARIFLHIDNTQHWDEHHRVHVPLVTNPGARLCVNGRFLFLRPGYAWVLNNSVPHGAINDGAERLHLVMDFAASVAFQQWIDDGTPECGEVDERALAELERDPLAGVEVEQVGDPARLARMLAQ